MLLREVEYARPGSIEEAVRLLGAHDGARALAGGQTLVNVMKARAASPEVLVDLADLSELRTIGRSADGSLELGAMVTYSELVRSPEVAAARPLLAEIAATIADRQVQNRGTVGGNVCVNDPTNHLPPLFAAMEATFTILGPGGERIVPAGDFFRGVYLTAVGEGELLTRVTLPALGAGSADAMEGITLGVHGTYLASAAACVSPGAVRIALGCVSGVPERATAVEHRLGGAELTPENVHAAVAGLGDSLDPPSDVHAPADYRRRLTEVVCERAVLAAATRAKG
ncbi:MAG: aerobic carbon-monoxide dehydrogenase medium subunit [Gaiellales bacterium]|jgi:carbon-monoxide dehydrogenase medium subunit|nr:aerobic carbon-monoxide dehydrogenase medium subunit [Gaiellales bacterium]